MSSSDSPTVISGFRLRFERVDMLGILSQAPQLLFRASPNLQKSKMLKISPSERFESKRNMYTLINKSLAYPLTEFIPVKGQNDLFFDDQCNVVP